MSPLLSLALFFIFGCIIGSFLNVIVGRMHTGRSLGGRSHCPSCGKPLHAMHLVPLLSYLCLRARCAFCSSKISPSYFMVEMLTGALFALSSVFITDPGLLGLYLALMASLVVILAYDLRHTIIPDEWVIIASLVAAVIAGYTSFESHDITGLYLRGIAALIGSAFFGVLWFLSKGRWVGLGDAKLAFPLGLLVSWPAVLSGLVLSFWLGAIVSVLLMWFFRLARGGQGRLRFLSGSLTMKSEIPFAPFLILGFLLTHFFAFDAFAIPYDFFF